MKTSQRLTNYRCTKCGRTVRSGRWCECRGKLDLEAPQNRLQRRRAAAIKRRQR